MYLLTTFIRANHNLRNLGGNMAIRLGKCGGVETLCGTIGRYSATTSRYVRVTCTSIQVEFKRMESVCLSQCTVCALGSQIGVPPAYPVGWWLCVHGEPHPTIGLYLYPLRPRADREGFPTWALVHVHTPQGGCARLVPRGVSHTGSTSTKRLAGIAGIKP